MKALPLQGWGYLVVISRASSWSWPFGGAWWTGGMTIDEAFHELVPVLGMVCLMDPGAEGTVVINLHFLDISE